MMVTDISHVETSMLSSEWDLNGQGVRELELAADKLRESKGGKVVLDLRDVIGLHKDGGDTLRFVAYTKKGAKSKHLSKKTVKLVASAKKSEEERKAQVESWHQVVLRLLGRDGEREKKKLLVFINPKSGPGHSMKMWNNVGKRVLVDEAGHQVDVVVTERANHALEYVQNHEDLCSAYKGVVIVSGDGLIYELLQGVMAREDWARCMRELPVGVLPGGSGNGLAKTVAAHAGLPHGPLAASIVVAKMRTSPLDVAAVDIYNGETVQRKYSFLSLEWALISDIDIGSEYLRWMGETRFTVEAIKRLIFLRKYRGRLSYKPPSHSCSEPPRTPKHPELSKPASYWETHDDDVHIDTPGVLHLPHPSEQVPEDWIVVEDTFWNMWNCNVSWMSGMSNVAPHSEFEDGYLQLHFVRENGPEKMSRWKLLKYLLGLDNGDHVGMPFVEMVPSQAYRFEPLPNKNGKLQGTLALDGEVVEYTSLQMQNLRGLWNIFAHVD